MARKSILESLKPRGGPGPDPWEGVGEGINPYPWVEGCLGSGKWDPLDHQRPEGWWDYSRSWRYSRHPPDTRLFMYCILLMYSLIYLHMYLHT